MCLHGPYRHDRPSLSPRQAEQCWAVWARLTYLKPNCTAFLGPRMTHRLSRLGRIDPKGVRSFLLRTPSPLPPPHATQLVAGAPPSVAKKRHRGHAGDSIAHPASRGAKVQSTSECRTRSRLDDLIIHHRNKRLHLSKAFCIQVSVLIETIWI